MTGNEVTDDQLTAASRFLEIAKWPTENQEVRITREQIVRLVAWYGALRYRGARDATGGTLESPGELVTVREDAATRTGEE